MHSVEWADLFITVVVLHRLSGDAEQTVWPMLSGHTSRNLLDTGHMVMYVVRDNEIEHSQWWTWRCLWRE